MQIRNVCNVLIIWTLCTQSNTGTRYDKHDGHNDGHRHEVQQQRRGMGGGLLIHVMYGKCLTDLYYDLQEHRCWSTNKGHTLERKRAKSKSEQDIFHDVSQPDRREFVQDVIWRHQGRERVNMLCFIPTSPSRLTEGLNNKESINLTVHVMDGVSGLFRFDVSRGKFAT